MVKRNILTFFAALAGCFLAASLVQAAEIMLEGPVEPIAPGQSFRVDALITADKEEINAAGGKIIFSANQLRLKETRDGQSLITFWIERPRLSAGMLTFSGLIPGGLTVQRGKLFSLIFELSATSTLARGTIAIKDQRVLLNDGAGTAAKVSVRAYNFTVGPSISVADPASASATAQTASPLDQDPPEPFTPAIARNDALYNGDWFAVFLAQDKMSGIDYYEVREQASNQPEKEGWQRAESPYRLSDQSLASEIAVRAVDRAGNVRIARVTPVQRKNGYAKFLFWCILLVFLVAIMAIRRFYGGRKSNFS